ncbi:MAG: type II restriction endonuclease [Negativicutes bacterium]|nr:type II restriction endonuclease [Negativicutes bacterium]
MPTDDQVHEKLKTVFQSKIPSGGEIAAAAVARALRRHKNDRKWIKHNFSKLVESVQLDAYEEYLRNEVVAGRKALAKVFLPLTGKKPTAQDLIETIGKHFHALDRFFLGLTQGRRARAGGAFEYLIKELFVQLRYPFSSQPIINGQPDFILPSVEHFRLHAADCIIFTVKRSLRERWRQIVTEGTRGLGFYLATIDEKIGANDLAEMNRARINLVVPTRIKALRADYEDAPNVITFEQFFRFHLDPGMKRWRAARII